MEPINSRLVLILLIIMLLAAPIQTVPAETDPSQQISGVMDEWAKDWKARNPEAIAALYAQDAVLYRAIGGGIAQTTSAPHAIGDFFERFFVGLADPKKGDFISHAEPHVLGDLAFDDGGLQYLANGKCRPGDVGDGPCVIKGYYLTVLQRGSDGKWLIVRQTFTQIGLGSTIYTPH
jgi:ketosteroid isomerase-like protein